MKLNGKCRVDVSEYIDGQQSNILWLFVWLLLLPASTLGEEPYALAFSTYLGGTDWEHARDVAVDSQGNVYLVGGTASTDFPVTTYPYQRDSNGGGEAVIVRLSADFTHLLYSTYMGGGSDDNGRTAFLDQDGKLYMAGSSNGPGWPAVNAFQSTFAGGGGNWGNGDCILAKFLPANTITVNPSVTCQTIAGWEATAWVAEPADPVFPYYKDTVFDKLVNDIGINRVRLEICQLCKNTQSMSAVLSATYKKVESYEICDENKKVAVVTHWGVSTCCCIYPRAFHCE